MKSDELNSLVRNLCTLSGEHEWVEFKRNFYDTDEIGQYISALSNSAALLGRSKAYVIWGIDDKSHDVVGTTFRPRTQKAGNKGKNSNQELESWLLMHLIHQVEFRFIEEMINDKHVVILEIQSAFSYPVRFKNTAFIRVGTYKKKLADFPEKERRLWEILGTESFEKGYSREHLSGEQVLASLDYGSYFKLIEEQVPTSQEAILSKLYAAQIIQRTESNDCTITNLGAILLANDLKAFGRLGRKALRIIKYQGVNRVNTVKEHLFNKGYAAIFEDAVEYINVWLPSNEEIEKALRRDVRVYPEIAIRELVANALIHQDFSVSGAGPTVEIFDNRIEITNPGPPLVSPLRFIDEPPRSRNEDFASIMRRMHICEERGSGIDKVIFNIELYQLPPPDFRATDLSTIAVLFSTISFNDLSKEEKIRACYQHACLQWVSGTQMSNSSLRKRLGIKDTNYPIASRIIKDSIAANLIKHSGDPKAKKKAKYVPFWA